MSYVTDVLRIFAAADLYDALMWRVSADDTVKFSVICSDFFCWATADAETIEPDDIELLQKCLDDLQAQTQDDYLLAELFAARKRRMRPMRLWLNTVDAPATVTLFLAAGPERDPNSEG